MKKILLILFLVGALLAWYYRRYPLTSSVTIRGHKIFVELAISPEERQKGLGYHDSLPKEYGVLFLMNEPAYHGFWMKGMRFPLDFVWINDKIVVDIAENVPYPVGDEEPVSLKPKVPADKVLEVNAGSVAEKGIQVGDTISFNN